MPEGLAEVALYDVLNCVFVSAKYGQPNCRLKMLFSCVPYARRLGLLHYQMTKTRTVSAEEVAIESSSSSAAASDISNL